MDKATAWSAHRIVSEQAKRRFKTEIDIRVGVHRGLVYLDKTQDDVYGLAANLAARVCALAPTGTVVVSDSVEPWALIWVGHCGPPP
jgi:class 3 adenylate cyclase